MIDSVDPEILIVASDLGSKFSWRWHEILRPYREELRSDLSNIELYKLLGRLSAEYYDSYKVKFIRSNYKTHVTYRSKFAELRSQHAPVSEVEALRANTEYDYSVFDELRKQLKDISI